METFIIVFAVVVAAVLMGLCATLYYSDGGLMAALIGTLGLWLVMGNWVLVLWMVMPISTNWSLGIMFVHMAIGCTLMGVAES